MPEESEASISRFFSGLLDHFGPNATRARSVANDPRGTGTKTPCPYANYAEYADQYPKGNMTDTEQCFGVFARMRTEGTDQSTQII